MTIADLNASSQSEFVGHIGWVFEHSSWVAERAWARRPFATIDAVHSAMIDVVARASEDLQLALVRAHPDLGSRLTMSRASSKEQSAAGFAVMDDERRATLAALITAYRARFGFPFLFAVKGATGDEVLAALQRRIDRSPSEEFAEALQQVYRIAGFRLRDAVREER